MARQQTIEAKRAASDDELKPLTELCKAGRLFEVQEWIEAGKPINAPASPSRRQRPRTPLEVAIDRGFHSLVQVLLEGGALQEPAGFDSPMNRALRARRFDMVQLFVEHGFDPKSVDAVEVFESWDPRIMEYFIQRGMDVEEGLPFAEAMCGRIRTALNVWKRYREQIPGLQEQGNIALRRHCIDGNMKWVSLLLWAGADPLTPGITHPSYEEDEADQVSAVQVAAEFGYFEVFELKPIREGPLQTHPHLIMPYLTHGKGIGVLKRLLGRGINPNDQANGGCSTIRRCLQGLSTIDFRNWSTWDQQVRRKGIDTPTDRERMKAIHLLAQHGAKWKPLDKHEVNDSRRSLLRMSADYTMEFVWIMAKYQACSEADIHDLLRTQSTKSLIAPYRERLCQFLQCWNKT